MQAPKSSKIQLPPKKEIDEDKIKSIINKGGSPASYTEEQNSSEIIKNFNVKMTEEDLKMVSILCKKRPSTLGRKLSFTKQEWLLEAIREKIDREVKEYNI
ncbi:MAG: hypothetical protein E6Q66_10460 [Pedobacter sp.]|nr:MAG: hypothetical protein E6Q66_10460 [Pedobacter sp.]